jgi:hypothetical protein
MARALEVRPRNSLARSNTAVSGVGPPRVSGAVSEDSEKPESSLMGANETWSGFLQTQRDLTVPTRMDPAFRGVAGLLARARSRRYSAEHEHAEDDTLPLDKTNPGRTSSAALGTETLLTDESQFYSRTSEAPGTAGGGSGTEEEPSPRQTMAPGRAA